MAHLVAPGVRAVTHASTSCYLVQADDGLTFVDAGLPRTWTAADHAVTEAGATWDDVRAIVLTHAHFDHLGFAARARDRHGVEVWVHADDEAIAHRPYGYRPGRSRLLYPVPGRPRVVATPGHTDGHCAFHLPDRDVVFTGDGLVTLDPYTGRTGPRIVARAGTKDRRTAVESLDAVAAAGASIVLPGHGAPWTAGVAAAADLARRAGAA